MKTLSSFIFSGFVAAIALSDLSANDIGQDAALKARMAGAALTWAGENGRLRQAMQALPKGGDIHSHLQGAVYAESWIEWAAEDGLCADMESFSLKFKTGETCAESGWLDAAAAQADDNKRRELINAMSTRSYVPTLNWSGHNDFFETFFHMAAKPERFGDALAEVAARAGHQNILYLELMETFILPELFPLLEGVVLSGDLAEDYKTLMDGAFGRALPDLVVNIRERVAAGHAKKDRILGCEQNSEAEGCDVEIRLIHQVIRSFPPENVFAQIILGWAVMAEEPMVVGLNLVAPEDGHVALRDYTYHMKMIDHLYKNLGPQNVTLHAGELTLGLVRPKQLRFHMWEALEIGHAKRLGHAIDVIYERDSEELVKKLAADDILVEINLTSNDVILGVSGKDHPIVLYRDLDVPYTLSTDDEGVSRIDLTHEYMRFYETYDVPYFELKYVSRNALTYSFLEGESLWGSEVCVLDSKSMTEPSGECEAFLAGSRKAQLQWELEQRFKKFENTLKI
ncbi:MAG: adenosine deaminase, partial [Kordiimonas sp.]